jgi:hypothetical protein
VAVHAWFEAQFIGRIEYHRDLTFIGRIGRHRDLPLKRPLRGVEALRTLDWGKYVHSGSPSPCGGKFGRLRAGLEGGLRFSFSRVDAIAVGAQLAAFFLSRTDAVFLFFLG